MALITCDNLSLGYDGETVASGVSFRVEDGDYLCIVGENGSGKTTLMKTLLGLLTPVSGQLIFGDGLRQNEIGYLPQQTVVQRDFPASVGEVVLSGCQGRCGLRPFYNRAEKRLAAESMERMGIAGLSERCYRELSGGQQQRVLLLDEPVTGLDPKVTAELYAIISKLNRDGITILMISHDVEAAVRYASHVLHMDKTVFFGTRAEYVKSGAGFGYPGGEGGAL